MFQKLTRKFAVAVLIGVSVSVSCTKPEQQEAEEASMSINTNENLSRPELTVDEWSDLAPAQRAGLASGQEAEETLKPIILRWYLEDMGEKLDCYFTYEDRPDPEGFYPWIAYIKDFVPDPDIATIDALVAKLDGELDGVKVVRSTKHPSVVHLIAEDLLQEGYVMDETVTTEYEGLLPMLADHLGALLDDKIEMRTSGSFRELYEWDSSTQVEVDVQNESVRDILTGAVPLEVYKRFLWESQQVQIDGTFKMQVRYYGRLPTLEDSIVSLEDYLLEMGQRLDCYFTVEDDPNLKPEEEYDDFAYILERGEFMLDLEITTIDALVAYLDEQLAGVKVVRSTKYPSVVHLIAEDLLGEGYVMDEEVTVQFEGDLIYFPEAVGAALNGQLKDASEAEPGAFPNHFLAGMLSAVEVAVEDELVRNALTGAVPLEDYKDYDRVLWIAVRIEVDQTPQLFVGYRGYSLELEESVPE